jgi:hypothetical protein
MERSILKPDSRSFSGEIPTFYETRKLVIVFTAAYVFPKGFMTKILYAFFTSLMTSKSHLP